MYFYVKYKSSGEKLYTLSLQKEKLQIEIDRIESELDNIDLQDIAGLAEEVISEQNKARQIIADLRYTLEENNVSDGQIQEVNTQIRDLKKDVSNLLSEVNDLKLQNMMLQKENDELLGAVKQSNSKVRQLTDDNSVLHDQVLLASSLKISNVVINGVEQRKNGSFEIETKARRTDKLQIKFSIVDNPLAKKGRKEIFGRVIDPKGNLIASNTDHFNVQGENLRYSLKESINFTNNGEEYQILWSDSDYKFEKGAYTVLLYVDNSIMGRSSVVLK